ncbi:MAG: ABC transporter ATP-binding protein [Paracoccus sp. (in: a-proteobacteria)]|uniref:ABC transporter ATP-binding protein n=1 Tax=Paracoccus sp. TaxID=267 RepID=UPI0039E59D09
MNSITPSLTTSPLPLAGNRQSGGATVEFEKVSKFYDKFAALHGVDLNIAPGEFLTLLGPSGSGKSTLLMLLAGFEAPTGGTIRVGGRDLNRVPPHRRNQGIVFQSYALFQHMTVVQNLAYPLDARGIPAAEQDRLIKAALARVRMEKFADRYPAQLSGGQQQRVALARALVFNPPVLLMDESLSALDRNLREEMQIELKIMHEELATTIVYVTHDQGEALTMSDRIAVMQEGRLVQLGTPRDLYDRPATGFVARFLGESVFFTGRVAQVGDGRARVAISNGDMLEVGLPGPATAGEEVQVMARPEAIGLAPCGQPHAGNGSVMLRGQVTRSIFIGNAFRYWVDCGGGVQVFCLVPSSMRHAAIERGTSVDVIIHPDDLRIVRG